MFNCIMYIKPVLEKLHIKYKLQSIGYFPKSKTFLGIGYWYWAWVTGTKSGFGEILMHPAPPH